MTGGDLEQPVKNFQRIGGSFQKKEDGSLEVKSNRVPFIDCKRLVEAEQRIFKPVRFVQNFSFVDIKIRIVWA